MKHIPSKHIGLLDHIKVLAISLVLLDHGIFLAGYEGYFQWADYIGRVAVAAFFFASGYLIEHTKREPFNTKDFLMMKVVRLFPLYFLSLAICFFLFPNLIYGDIGIYVISSQAFMLNKAGFLWFVSFYLSLMLLFAGLQRGRRTAFIALAVFSSAILLSGNYFNLVNLGAFLLGVVAKGRQALDDVQVSAGRNIRTISGSTYAIYLFHVPLAEAILLVVQEDAVFWALYFVLSLGVGISIQKITDSIIYGTKRRLPSRQQPAVQRSEPHQKQHFNVLSEVTSGSGLSDDDRNRGRFEHG